MFCIVLQSLPITLRNCRVHIDVDSQVLLTLYALKRHNHLKSPGAVWRSLRPHHETLGIRFWHTAFSQCHFPTSHFSFSHTPIVWCQFICTKPTSLKGYRESLRSSPFQSYRTRLLVPFFPPRSPSLNYGSEFSCQPLLVASRTFFPFRSCCYARREN